MIQNRTNPKQIKEIREKVKALRKEYNQYKRPYYSRENWDRGENYWRARTLDRLIMQSCLKRQDIAECVGITPTYLSRLLRSKTEPLRPDMQRCIEQALPKLIQEASTKTLNLCLIDANPDACIDPDALRDYPYDAKDDLRQVTGNFYSDLTLMVRIGRRGEAIRRAKAQLVFRKALEKDRQGREFRHPDWEENNARVVRLNLIIDESGLLRKDIAREVDITPAYLSRLLRSREPLIPETERKIEQSVRSLLKQASRAVRAAKRGDWERF